MTCFLLFKEKAWQNRMAAKFTGLEVVVDDWISGRALLFTTLFNQESFTEFKLPTDYFKKQVLAEKNPAEKNCSVEAKGKKLSTSTNGCLQTKPFKVFVLKELHKVLLTKKKSYPTYHEKKTFMSQEID